MQSLAIFSPNFVQVGKCRAWKHSLHGDTDTSQLFVYNYIHTMFKNIYLRDDPLTDLFEAIRLHLILLTKVILKVL